MAQLGDRADVRIQGSFAAGDRSEPQPDIAVIPPGDYLDAHPDEAHLIVESADSSLTRDRTTKAEVYAGSEVPEYWIMDLLHRVVEVRTAPSDGSYTSLLTRGRGETLSPSRFPAVTIAVRDILR